MKKQLALVVAGLVAVLLLAGQLAHAAAGPEPNDIQDTMPFWSSDARWVAYDRSSPNLQHVLRMSASGKQTRLVAVDGQVRGVAGDGLYLLVEANGTTRITAGERFTPPYRVLQGTDASTSTEGRVAYLRNGSLYASGVAGSGEFLLATGIDPPSWDVLGPVWSPDGTQIVVASGSSLVLVHADGSGSRVLFSGANQSVNPSWSPDGKTIAFERNFGPHWQIWLVGADGSNPHALFAGDANYRFPQFSPVSATLAFISDRQHAKGGATQYQFALYRTGIFDPAVHKLLDDVHPYSPPRWSPTAAQIAVSAGQECRRWGIYVGRSDVGSHFTRRSNPCRFDGNGAPNTLRGTPYFDIVNGFGGDDRLYGYLGNDAIYGENGNDTVFGGDGNDVIFGGPGDDRLYGGYGNDVIIGGNGRDLIDCGPGTDTVEGSGPLDRIAKNCEHVRH